MLEEWNEMLKDPQQYMYNRDLEGIDLNGMSIKEKESSLPSLKSVAKLRRDEEVSLTKVIDVVCKIIDEVSFAGTDSVMHGTIEKMAEH